MKAKTLGSAVLVVLLVGCTPSMPDKDYRPVNLATQTGGSSTPSDPAAIVGQWIDIWRWNDHDYTSSLEFKRDGTGKYASHVIFNFSHGSENGSHERTFKWRWVNSSLLELDISEPTNVINGRVMMKPFQKQLTFDGNRLHDHMDKRTLVRSTDTATIAVKVNAAKNRVQLHNILERTGNVLGSVSQAQYASNRALAASQIAMALGENMGTRKAGGPGGRPPIPGNEAASQPGSGKFGPQLHDISIGQEQLEYYSDGYAYDICGVFMVPQEGQNETVSAFVVFRGFDRASALEWLESAGAYANVPGSADPVPGTPHSSEQLGWRRHKVVSGGSVKYGIEKVDYSHRSPREPGYEPYRPF